jgi:hypothetical protein
VDHAFGSRRCERRWKDAGRGTMAVMVWLSDRISDRDVSGRPGTPQMTGVIKAASVGETWNNWDAQARLGCGLVCS